MAYNPLLPAGQATMAASSPVVIASNQTAIPVSGTFWQATQPVSIAASVAVTGTFYQATQPVSLISLPSLAAGSNAIGSITNTAFGISGTLPAYASTPTFNIGTISTIATESTLSTLNTKIPSNLTVTSTRLLVDGSGVTQPVTVVSGATGGDSTFHLVSAAATNATNIKASAGKVTGWYIYNSNASARKVNFYNANTTPVLGTTTLHSAIIIPGLAAANVSFPNGIDFGTGIGIATVTELTDAGNTAVALNDLIINIYFK
jgi:hypothetical protein